MCHFKQAAVAVPQFYTKSRTLPAVPVVFLAVWSKT